MAEQILQMGRGHGLEGKDLPEALCRLYEALTGRVMPRADLPRDTGPELREARVVWLGQDFFESSSAPAIGRA